MIILIQLYSTAPSTIVFWLSGVEASIPSYKYVCQCSFQQPDMHYCDMVHPVLTVLSNLVKKNTKESLNWRMQNCNTCVPMTNANL